VVLPDGVYTNATITVENGCIIAVEQGTPFLYQPDSCCATPGEGGGGEGGLDGPPGPPGAAATVNVGTVSSLPPASAPTITNVGTPTNAILNFAIPRGEDGIDGATPTGVTDNTAGIDIVAGSVQALPLTWPPVLLVNSATSDTAGAALTATKDPVTGAVSLDLSLAAFYTDIQAYINDQIATAIAPLQSDITTIQSTCCGE
jgi:hypothetical protein